ncbi:MAG: hypothetical protein CMM46_15225 [Rhodospirillaceae bacterium]|nr:hypothetical protein [Rhodospirillaceae bacterium]
MGQRTAAARSSIRARRPGVDLRHSVQPRERSQHVVTLAIQTRSKLRVVLWRREIGRDLIQPARPR